MKKWNNGRGAVVCDDCSTVIHYGFSNDKEDLCAKCNKFRTLWYKIGLPEQRRAATASNASWFLRTGWTSCKDHPSFHELEALAKEIVREHQL